VVDDDQPNAGSQLAVVRGGASSPMAFDATPIYRVLEVFRDGNGRLRKEGRVWHTDLNRMRKFGRAVASNTSSLKVLITDAAGDVMEEISPPPAELRQSRWDSWEAIALPPCPPKVRKKPRVRKPEPPKALPATTPFGALDVGALRTALGSASGTPEQAADASVAAAGSAGTSGSAEAAAAGQSQTVTPAEPATLTDSPLVGDFGSERSLL
jgi:hypothetical protein